MVDRALVKKLLEDGEKFVYISRVTGCPLGSIRRYAEREVDQKEKWSEEQINKLIELRESGLNYKDIAERLNRSVNAIKQQYYIAVKERNLKRASVSRRVVNVELITKLLNQGEKVWYIAKAAKCTMQTVYNIKESINNENCAYSVKWTTDQRIKAMEMYLSNKNYSEISRAVGHSRNSVRQEIYYIKKGRRSVSF